MSFPFDVPEMSMLGIFLIRKLSQEHEKGMLVSNINIGLKLVEYVIVFVITCVEVLYIYFYFYTGKQKQQEN